MAERAELFNQAFLAWTIALKFEFEHINVFEWCGTRRDPEEAPNAPKRRALGTSSGLGERRMSVGWTQNESHWLKGTGWEVDERRTRGIHLARGLILL